MPCPLFDQKLPPTRAIEGAILSDNYVHEEESDMTVVCFFVYEKDAEHTHTAGLAATRASLKSLSLGEMRRGKKWSPLSA